MNRSTEEIPVSSQPPGALVRVSCGSAPAYGGVTPTVIKVERAAIPCGLTISKEGYEDAIVEFHRVRSGATRANEVPGVIFGAVTGILTFGILLPIPPYDPAVEAAYDAGHLAGSGPVNAVDERSGAAWKQVPGEVSVTLTPR